MQREKTGELDVQAARDVVIPDSQPRRFSTRIARLQKIRSVVEDEGNDGATGGTELNESTECPVSIAHLTICGNVLQYRSV